MSLIKFSPDLFLESQELNRFTKSLDRDGFRKLFLLSSIGFGLFNNSVGGAFDNFLIGQGTNPGTIKNNEGYAVDSNGQIIHRLATDNFLLADDSLYKWIKISYAQSPIELGSVSIDKAGNLTGSGTEFLAVLRGLPNNPTRISFSGSALNTQEYDVVSVVSDTVAVLAGVFQTEVNIQYQVVGSFTPDIVVPASSKYPFQYDACNFTVVAETVLDIPPAFIPGLEFYIARVKRTGATIIIQDKRKNYIYQSKANYLLTDNPILSNPLIGVEQINFNSKLSPKSNNVVQIAWGFRSTNWTFNSSTNIVTLLGGQGGLFKDTSYFVNGNFDGFKLFIKGKSYTVRQSSVAALQINLVLNTLDPDDFTDAAQEIHVVPNAEEIEIIATPSGTSLNAKKIAFPVNEGFCKIQLEVFLTGSVQYTFSYRYKTFAAYTVETTFPSDSIGLFNEAQFDADGNQTGVVRTPYVAGLITLTESTTSYNNTISSLVTGDLFGLELLPLSNVMNVNIFRAGTRKQNVLITQDIDLTDSASDTSFNFTTDQYIDLRTDVPTTLKAGNSFMIEVLGQYIPGAFNLYIVQDYVNAGSPGLRLYRFSADDYVLAANKRLTFRCVFDGDIWIVQRVTDVDVDGSSVLLDAFGRITLSPVGSWVPFTAPQFPINGWVGLPAGPRYRINRDGRVTIRISGIDGNSTASNANFANLPLNIIPAETQLAPCYLAGTNIISPTKTFAVLSSGTLAALGFSSADQLRNYDISYWLD